MLQILRCVIIDVSNKPGAAPFQRSNKDTQTRDDAKPADGLAYLQPAALVSHHPEEVDGEPITEHDQAHEERAGGEPEALVEDPQGCGENDEGDEDLEHEEGAL